MVKRMLILPGITDSGGAHDDRGLLDRRSACEYARRKGYVPKVLDIPGRTGANSPQVRAALTAIREDGEIAALYGFSGGGYNAKRILGNLDARERARLDLVVVLGAPGEAAGFDETEWRGFYAGPWELVYRLDPPSGHMDGPKVLLDATPEPIPIGPVGPVGPVATGWRALVGVIVQAIARLFQNKAAMTPKP
jgi:hypothetical protein